MSPKQRIQQLSAQFIELADKSHLEPPAGLKTRPKDIPSVRAFNLRRQIIQQIEEKQYGV